jgi:hypothetical protein
MFISELIVKELQDGRKELIKPLVYIASNDVTLIVKVGFITDYASIPRLPIVFLVFEALDNRAATLHDSLYSNPKISRKLADSLFLEAMITDKTTSTWKAKLAYYAVRLCGRKVRFAAYGIDNE